jgi:hypothetical protein
MDRTVLFRTNEAFAAELLSSLQKHNPEEGDALLDLAIRGLNALHAGKGGKVRLENTYAYFDADFWDSKVYVNIRLKQDHWSLIENLKNLHFHLQTIGYTSANRIENVHFDNRIHIFIPYRKPDFELLVPSSKT